MKSVIAKIRRIFFTGLLVSLPLAITIVFLRFCFESLDNLLGPLAATLLRRTGAPVPVEFVIPGLGVTATILLIFSIGLATTNYIGKKIWEAGETLLTRIPVIRSVYTGAKQVIETFANGGGQSFRKVVILEWPRKGAYTLAFLTGKTGGELQDKLGGGRMANVYVPTTPNPTSGYMMIVPEDDITELEMSVEDGLKMIISGGAVAPDFKREGADKTETPESSDSNPF